MSTKDKLHQLLAKRISQGIEYGRCYEMSEPLFRLGCTLHESQGVDLHAWVNWMSDAVVSEGGGVVNVRHRDGFFCDWANRKLGHALSTHFKRPVRFSPDTNIHQRVVQ